MESRTKVLGHPVHPMLIVFPLGLFVAALIRDILYLVTGNQELPIVSYYAILGGVAGGFLAAIFGLVDWLAILAMPRAKDVGLRHSVGNVIVVLLFAISWWLRRGEAGYLPDGAPFLFALLGGGTGLVAAWLGGELADRLAVGVDPGAHLNSPSSLSDHPASDSVK